MRAYAKINLTLDVGARRADGYHPIASVMREISMYDDVDVQTAPGSGIVVEMDLPGVAPEQNTCYKAAKAFLETFDVSASVRIRVKKRIPSGAGLGGGSSDAAAVLKLLNAQTGINAAPQALAKAALCVGADVPFFIDGGAQLAEGIGEKLTPLQGFDALHLIVAKPARGASTREIYDLFDGLPPGRGSTKAFVDALRSGGDPYPFIGNMLQPVTQRLVPEVKTLCETLIALGAAQACMSGSGSAVFGRFLTARDARAAFEKLDTHAQAALCTAR